MQEIAFAHTTTTVLFKCDSKFCCLYIYLHKNKKVEYINPNQKYLTLWRARNLMLCMCGGLEWHEIFSPKNFCLEDARIGSHPNGIFKQSFKFAEGNYQRDSDHEFSRICSRQKNGEFTLLSKDFCWDFMTNYKILVPTHTFLCFINIVKVVVKLDLTIPKCK